MMHKPVHLRDLEPPPRFVASWERLKYKEAHWLVEMFAEMVSVLFIIIRVLTSLSQVGVFLYVYAGEVVVCC